MILIAGLMICTTLSAIPRSFWWRGFAAEVIRAPVRPGWMAGFGLVYRGLRGVEGFLEAVCGLR